MPVRPSGCRLRIQGRLPIFEATATFHRTYGEETVGREQKGLLSSWLSKPTPIRGHAHPRPPSPDHSAHASHLDDLSQQAPAVLTFTGKISVLFVRRSFRLYVALTFEYKDLDTAYQPRIPIARYPCS